MIEGSVEPTNKLNTRINIMKPETYITKKKINKKNINQDKRFRHFRKRKRKLELAKGYFTMKDEKELWLRKELLFEKNYYQNQKQEPDTRSLEERAKEMRQMKSKRASQLEEDILSWSQFAREQRNNNRRQRIVLHTGETL